VIAAVARERFAPRSVQKGVRRRVQNGVHRSVQKGVRTLSVNPTVDERIPKAGRPAASFEILGKGIEQPRGTGRAPQQPAAPTGRKRAAGSEVRTTVGGPHFSRSSVDLAHKVGVYETLAPRIARRVLDRADTSDPIKDPSAYLAKSAANAALDATLRCAALVMASPPLLGAQLAPPRPPPIRDATLLRVALRSQSGDEPAWQKSARRDEARRLAVMREAQSWA
jgi:hypothetical protein